jgi:hypothetical protein
MNGWITQGMKISHKHKRKMYTWVRTVIKQKQKHITSNIVKSPQKWKKEAKKQHYSRLTAKSDKKNKNNMKNYKETTKVHSAELIPPILTTIINYMNKNQCLQ